MHAQLSMIRVCIGVRLQAIMMKTFIGEIAEQQGNVFLEIISPNVFKISLFPRTFRSLRGRLA